MLLISLCPFMGVAVHGMVITCFQATLEWTELDLYEPLFQFFVLGSPCNMGMGFK